ncbi:transcriptional regulator [Streptomyces cyaneofuscatus]|nr:transcriptional regulator [Streptomyces sp. CBMAI 2042]
MSYYRIVLAEGMQDDLVEYLDRDLLLTMWPTLRTLISRDIRDVWESAFDELAIRARAAA